MATIIKKRLQYQPTGRRGLDRSIIYVIGELSDIERSRLRGTIFTVTSGVDATRTHNDLLRMAREACDAGTVDEFLDALDGRAKAGNSGPQFGPFANEWLSTCIIGAGRRETLIENDSGILRNHLLPEFASLPLGAVDARRVDLYKAAKRQQKHQYGIGFSPQTINNHLSVLHRIFEKAIEYGHVEKNPVGKRAWLKSDKTAEDGRPWWTPDEESRVFVVLDKWRKSEPRLRLAILTQLLTGIRFGELRALQKRDLDLKLSGLWVRRAQARKIVTTPKNKKARFQALPGVLARELSLWSEQLEGELLFPAVSGRALPNNSLNRAYTRLSDEAGVRRISSHGARHTSGSSYALMGASQKMIATILGHSNTAATERYTHVQVGATRALVEERWSGLANPTET